MFIELIGSGFGPVEVREFYITLMRSLRNLTSAANPT
jgi:hypothetical protein